MRVTLQSPTLARHAGRFVWLELNFDSAVNRAFLTRYQVGYTPSLFVLDPRDGRATAAHHGGMTESELLAFLDQGERGWRGAAQSPADSALARGDAALGRALHAEAVLGYEEALRLGGPRWPGHAHAVDQLTWTLWGDRRAEACAETARVEAPAMARGPAFARVVLAGYSCSLQGGNAEWGTRARATLEPLAIEALGLSDVTRDIHFQLYQALIQAAQQRGDTVAVARWDAHWMDDLDAITPRSEDERTALDVARSDAANDSAAIARAIPALRSSERAMPMNYNASLRLAQLEVDAGRFDDALAACARGFARGPGPIGRTWLFEIEAQARSGKGDIKGARRSIAAARHAADGIIETRNRENNLRRIGRMEGELAGK